MRFETLFTFYPSIEALTSLSWHRFYSVRENFGLQSPAAHAAAAAAVRSTMVNFLHHGSTKDTGIRLRRETARRFMSLSRHTA